MTDCRICQLLDTLDELPFSEQLWLDDHWRMSHGWSSLEGWLVLSPRRHVHALDELEPAESTTLGALLPAATATLRKVVGAERTYVMLFSEAEGFAHLHIHIVPRMPWFTAQDVGPNVFHFLNPPVADRVREPRLEELSRQIAADLAARLA